MKLIRKYFNANRQTPTAFLHISKVLYLSGQYFSMKGYFKVKSLDISWISY